MDEASTFVGDLLLSYFIHQLISAMRKTIYLLTFCIYLFPAFSLEAQWFKTNGLPGGSTSSLINYGDTVLTSVGNGTYVYTSNELYFSTNHGETWLPIINPSYCGISALSIEGQNVFGYAYDRSAQSLIRFRTDDFFQTLHPISNPDTLDLREFFMAHGYLYGSKYSSTKLYRTNNDGATWEYVAALSPNAVAFDGQRITVADYHYILQSTDEGYTWDTLLQYSGWEMQLLQHENRLFVFKDSPITGCYASNDYGQTWQFYQSNNFNQFYQFIWHNERIYGFDGERMIKSSDFSQTWETVPLPSNSVYPAYKGISSGNALIIGGVQSIGSSGMYRSLDNGSTWDSLSSGLVASSGKLRKFGNDLYVPGRGGLYKVEADGINWTKIDLAIPQDSNYYWFISDFVKTGNNWLLSDGQDLWVSQDQGNAWFKSSVPLGQGLLPTNVLELENIGNKVIAHGLWQGDVYYYYISEDNGLSFTYLESLKQQFQTNITSLYVFGQQVYVLASNKKIYRSYDGCITWVLQSDSIPVDSLTPYGFHTHSLLVSNNVIVASTGSPGNRMCYSKDNGQTWTYYNLTTAGFPWGIGAINDLLHVGSRLVAATQNGIYVSKNEGDDWTDWNDGLLTNFITDIGVHNGFLWASTKGDGIWKRPLGQLFISPTLDQVFIDPSFQLSPNPASQLVKVQTGGESGELILFDAMGRVVLRQTVESSETQLYVKGLPQGIYQVIFIGEKGMRYRSLVVQR